VKDTEGGKIFTIEEKDAQTLTALGLTNSQAKVFLTLAKSGVATAKEISTVTQVARQEVYRVLVDLQKLALVEKIVSAPSKFRAISTADAFSILMERRKKETSELQTTINEMLKKFKGDNVPIALEEEETRFSLIPEQANVRVEKKTLDNVQKSFDVITSWRNPHSVIFASTEGIAKALQRGIEIRIIIDIPGEEKILSDIVKRLKKFPNFKIRYLQSAPKALISVYDKGDAWVGTCPNPGVKECPVLWTANPCLLSILQDYFEMLWLAAVER
jgi:sugar-specific transcriptional regulator TrmB